MKCIIVDDEPIARIGIKELIKRVPQLELTGSFEDTRSASDFLSENPVDLVFLDVQMPGVNGIDFARHIQGNTLVIFTTAYSEYALDSYEVDAVDYLIKPIEWERFSRAVHKAATYHSLLLKEEKEIIDNRSVDFLFVRSERKYVKVTYKEILFVEGLKDYVIIQTENRKIITKMYLTTMQDLLPQRIFLRINRSYIINLEQIDSFNNNDVFIKNYEIAIGDSYREAFFRVFASNRNKID